MLRAVHSTRSLWHKNHLPHRLPPSSLFFLPYAVFLSVYSSRSPDPCRSLREVSKGSVTGLTMMPTWAFPCSPVLNGLPPVISTRGLRTSAATPAPVPQVTTTGRHPPPVPCLSTPALSPQSLCPPDSSTFIPSSVLSSLAPRSSGIRPHGPSPSSVRLTRNSTPPFTGLNTMFKDHLFY